ncbi:MAG: BatD family protein [Spirochaetes bacterium]|jgi:uncharacterized OsmC-like protein|nr:BatD family protein [Spirochaetota bacterium]
MKGGSLKRTGRIIFIAALFFLCSARAFPEVATVLEGNRISVGETTEMHIRFSGMSGDIEPVSYPAVPGLRIAFTGTQKNYEFINGVSRFGVSFTFMIQAEKKGVYRIPPFVFKAGGNTVKSREVALTVSGEGGRPQSIEEPLSTSVTVSKKKLYVGEPFIMRYFLSSGNIMEFSGFEKPPEIRGFVSKGIDTPDDRDLSSDRASEGSPLMISAMAALSPGRHKIGGGTAVVMEGGGGMLSVFPQQKRIQFGYKDVEVVEIPAAGRPKDFNGDVGSFAIKSDFNGSPVKAYEEKKVTVVVSGTGNFITLAKPGFTKDADGARVLAEEGDTRISVENNRLRGEKKFIFTIVPEKPGTLDLGKVRMAYFDAEAGAFRAAETDSIRFEVRPGEKKKKTQADGDAGDGGPEFNPVYIALIAAAAAGGMTFMIIWERRRYRQISGEKSVKDDRYEEKTGDAVGADRIAEMKSSLDKMDSASFIRSAEKAIDEISSGPSDGDAGRLAELREAISGYRYAGRKINGDDMKSIYVEIRKIKEGIL